MPFFDQIHVGFNGWRQEAHGYSLLPGSSGSSNSVHKIRSRPWQVVIDNSRLDGGKGERDMNSEASAHHKHIYIHKHNNTMTKLEIKNMRCGLAYQSRNIDSSTGHIRAQQDADLSVLQVLQAARACVLIEFPVQLTALDPVPTQLATDVFRGVSGRYKDQDPIPFVSVVFFQQFAQNLCPGRLFHPNVSEADC